MEAPNRNLLWAQIVVDELARCGLTDVCIAPGSRSTPLVFAFAEHPAVTVHSHIDERSAAFFALGLALASDRPVAVLCSSGTATANFFPAIIEAHYAQVPLLVLTADRPHELRESGANQTVDQVKLYGDHVLWSFDVPPPEAEPAPLTVRALRTLACRAYARADGTPKGAVHLNFPFRKPLEPTPAGLAHAEDGRADGQPYTQIVRMTPAAPENALDLLTDTLAHARRGLIVCGPRSGGDSFPAAVQALAEALRFPLLADGLANVRFHASSALVLGGHDTFLAQRPAWDEPDVIVHFGALPTSAALDSYLSAIPDARRIMISANGVWSDANHQIDTLITADPAQLCRAVIDRLPVQGQQDEAWTAAWLEAERAVWRALDALIADGVWFDGAAVACAMDSLPDSAYVYIGNSLAVRHVDQFARPNNKRFKALCNRGASGIDGTVSSALGASIAAAREGVPLTLICGDLAFYHDLNGLLAVRRCGARARFIVVNNDGGGIFHRLPVAQFDPPFTELFVTPHGLSFEHAAALYDLAYTQPQTIHALSETLQQALAGERAQLIEVKTDAARDLEARQVFIRAALQRSAFPISS